MSHAVGCAFAICLEKKQKREKEAVSVQFNDKGTSFARTGSFRQATLTERLADPQSVIAAGKITIQWYLIFIVINPVSKVNVDSGECLSLQIKNNCFSTDFETLKNIR